VPPLPEKPWHAAEPVRFCGVCEKSGGGAAHGSRMLW